MFLAGRICAELCNVCLDGAVVELCTCILQASLSVPSCPSSPLAAQLKRMVGGGNIPTKVLPSIRGQGAHSDWIPLRAVSLFLNIIWAMQQDPSWTSWDTGDGQALCAWVRSVVQSTMLLGRWVSIGKVLYWGSEFKTVTAPYLANLGASRPEVMVKHVAMLPC